MVTLATAILIGLALAGYLTLVRNQNSMVARSQAWNAALVSAEAGIEEAFANVNNDMPKLRTNGTAWSASRTMSGGSYSVSYAAYPATNAPIFYATGYCTVPSLSATLVRVIRVQTVASSLFSSALVALGNIDMKGNNIMTDSFNSTNGAYANGPHGTNGDVASINGLVNVGSANINGDVLLGAGNTNSLQSITNSINQNNGKVTGTIANDFNMDLPTASLPKDFTNPFNGFPSGGNKYPGYANAALASGDYTLPNGLTTSLIVPSNKTVRLYIGGNVKITTSPGITVQQGGNLTIYMDGSSFSVSGNGALNVGGTAASFTYIGLTNNTSISMAGSASFTGTIYAPNADLKASGNGAIYGSVLVKSAALSGNFSFHYDDALAGSPMIRGYVGSSWREL
jgi:hypothetical protein